MSRTHHVTRHGKRPHRQRGSTRLTKHPGDWYHPYEQRPSNTGTSRAPGGGYAKDRAAHALYKKIGRRVERRRRNRGECE